MTLFDKIKKSLFGHDDKDETEVKEKVKSDTDQNKSESAEQPRESDDSDPSHVENAEIAPKNDHEEIPMVESDSDHEALYENGLKKTNESFSSRLNAFFAKFRTVDDNFFDDLEDLLIESDVGYETAAQLADQMRDQAKLEKAYSKDDLKKVIVEKLVTLYAAGGQGKNEHLCSNPEAHPNVYLFVGVNGAGKTTTIAKLAKRFHDQHKKVMMVAADTFRAGAVEQLLEWGKRLDVPVFTGKAQADPAAVVYDAVSQAKTQRIDYLLVDTAGRLQNKVNLMNELRKIEQTIEKQLSGQPNEVLLVIDGSTGQNALLQAKEFNQTTELTGLVLTKLDGSSKGGVVLAIRNEMALPVKLVGLGERAEDLADFDAESYARGLFKGLLKA